MHEVASGTGRDKQCVSKLEERRLVMNHNIAAETSRVMAMPYADGMFDSRSGLVGDR
jgi:hypothetical protein